MSRQNVEIVRRLVEGEHGAPYSAWLESVDPEIEVDAALGGDLDGTYRGLGEVAKMLQAFWGEFDDARTEIEECISAGEHVVLGCGSTDAARVVASRSIGPPGMCGGCATGRPCIGVSSDQGRSTRSHQTV
jgi:hypothetical protein